MNYKQLTRRLSELGCEFARQAPGSHEVWRNQKNHTYAIVPRHSGRDIPIGTLRSVLRQLGIPPDEFYKKQS